jgi:hypothetical protein
MQQTTHQARPAVAAPSTSRILHIDVFTLGVGIAVAILIPIAFVLVLSQPRAEPASEATPGGVAHNYYLAVMHDDLSAAYAYLSSETHGWLSYEQFTAQVSRRPETRGVRIQDERIEDSAARVTVSVTTYVPTGPFSNNEITSQHILVLRPEGGAWRIALPAPPTTPGYSPYTSPYELYGW